MLGVVLSFACSPIRPREDGHAAVLPQLKGLVEKRDPKIAIVTPQHRSGG
jgi:hypothetical protein